MRPSLLSLAAVASAAVCLAAPTVHTNFPGGSLGKVEMVAPTHFRLHLAGQTDQDGRNRQANWYYFRIDGAAGQSLTLDLVNLPGEYNYQPNRGAVTADTLPVYSEDNRTWSHFASAHYAAAEPRLRLTITPKSNTLYIAHTPPYTAQHLSSLLNTFNRSPYLTQRSIGKSVEGRDLIQLTITDPAVPTTQKKTLWFMARQHAWESGSSWAAEGAIRFLLSNDASAARLRRQVTVHIFPLCDPDGVHHGGVRFNRHGYDLNRNWDMSNPRLMPEIDAQRRAIFAWLDAGNSIDIFLSLHNTETGEYLDGPPGNDSRHELVLQRLAAHLEQLPTFFPSRPARRAATTTTEGKPGRMTVVQGLYRDRQIPAFLIEQRISLHPKLKRLPTIQDRLQFGASLMQAMYAAVIDP
jgi:hypothetical protein